MVHECLQPEEAALVAGLPEADPRRRSATDCPQCRVLLQSFGEFMRAEVAEGSRPEASRLEISTFVRGQLAAGAITRPSGRRASAVRLQRVLLALAAALVVGVGITRWQPWEKQAARVERSDAGDRFPAPVVTALAGSVELNWQIDPAADSYLVVLMGEDLSELRQFGPQPQTRLDVPLEELRAASHFDAVAWQIRSLHEGAVLSRSELAFMELE